MNKEYKMIFTWEGEVPVDEYGEPLAYTPFDYYCDCPEDGIYEGEAEFDTLSEYDEILKDWEGHLYQLFKKGKKDRIGSGCFGPNSPVEEIVLDGVNCCGNCKECFWREAYYDGGGLWMQYQPEGCNYQDT